MRVTALLISILAVAPSTIFAAPIDPIHYAELEARWNPFHLSDHQKQQLKSFGGKALSVAKAAAPVALTLAPLFFGGRSSKRPAMEKRSDEELEHIYRRLLEGDHEIMERGLSEAEQDHLFRRYLEDEQHLERRISEKAKNFWRKVGEGAKKTWEVLGPTAAELALHHYKLIAREESELQARALHGSHELSRDHEAHFVPRSIAELDERDEMPLDLVERDEFPVELMERDFIYGDMSELERRGLSEKAKNFWRKVGHGAEKGFEMFGPLALQVAAAAAHRGTPAAKAPAPKLKID